MKIRIPVPILSRCGAALLWLLFRTIRVRFVLPTRAELDVIASRNVILGIWHGRQLIFPPVYWRIKGVIGVRPMRTLISEHYDGRVIAETVARFGIGSVAGSSTRRGREAYFELIRYLSSGDHGAVTPDGPKGPAEVVKPGVVYLASRSGTPILALGAAVDRAWRFSSWDSMILPKPFSRVVVSFGPVVTFTAEDVKNKPMEQLTSTLAEVLHAANTRASKVLTRSKEPVRDLLSDLR